MAGLPQRLNRGGEAVIFCQCLGDETGVFFDREVRSLCEAQGWRCTAAHTERLNAGAQIEQVSELTALFQEPFDKDGFRRRMRGIYDGLDAKYLYSVLYRIENSGTPGFVNVDTYNPWHTADRAAAAEDWGAVSRGGMDCVTLGGRMKRTVSEDVTELIRLLEQGESVERAAKWLYVLYKKTLLGPKARYYAYLTSILTTCRLLETDGILRRIPTA